MRHVKQPERDLLPASGTGAAAELEAGGCDACALRKLEASSLLGVEEEDGRRSPLLGWLGRLLDPLAGEGVEEELALFWPSMEAGLVSEVDIAVNKTEGVWRCLLAWMRLGVKW